MEFPNLDERPVIGVTPLYDSKKESLWMLPGYMKMIEKSGGVPFMLPLTADRETIQPLYEMCDGILFTGGQDVAPQLYGEEISAECGETCEMRDCMERILFEKVYEEDKPAFGICRGIQFINVMMGGSLYQDIAAEYEQCGSKVLTGEKDLVEHHMEPPYDHVCHEVLIERKTPLYQLLGKDKIGVNSYHHQAVKRLGKALIPMAYSEDGLVEAVACKDRSFIWAVQWHPEFNYEKEETSQKLVRAFVAACRSVRTMIK